MAQKKIETQQYPLRFLWCFTCNSPEKHSIKYHGTHTVEGVMHCKFDSVCERCFSRAESGIQAHPRAQMHSVLPKEYNALINRIIYDTT